MDPAIQAEIARPVALALQHYAPEAKEQSGTRLVLFPGKGHKRE